MDCESNIPSDERKLVFRVNELTLSKAAATGPALARREKGKKEPILLRLSSGGGSWEGEEGIPRSS